MRRIVKLTEADLTRLVKKVIKEQQKFEVDPKDLEMPELPDEETLKKFEKVVPDFKNAMKACVAENNLYKVKGFLDGVETKKMNMFNTIMANLFDRKAGGKSLNQEFNEFTKCINQKIGNKLPKIGNIKEQKLDRVLNAASAGATAGALGGAAAGAPFMGVGAIPAAIVGGIGGALWGAIGAIISADGTSDQKVKQFCDLCKKSKVQITQRSNQQADAIRDSVEGMGTDEDKVYRVVRGLRTFDEFCALVKSYEQSYGVELYKDLDADIDNESEWVQIYRPLRDIVVKQQQSQVKR